MRKRNPYYALLPETIANGLSAAQIVRDGNYQFEIESILIKLSLVIFSAEPTRLLTFTLSQIRRDPVLIDEIIFPSAVSLP